ncbi:hypothetical protein MHPYR_770014 [uncultured Mycobacterium sp.]|uniref:Uncharacterized protein n=1 Tax=uncultured Mycobacterium sp. TaxID=171292 RepID=A0A1Y5PKY3_9MYCO|nr:hypothetical protein MHPYR_770014 [uncultured Mycobacterium sp.]
MAVGAHRGAPRQPALAGECRWQVVTEYPVNRVALQAREDFYRFALELNIGGGCSWHADNPLRGRPARPDAPAS